MIEPTTRCGTEEATEAAPEIWGRYSLLANNHEIHVTVTVIVSDGIGTNVRDSNNDWDRFTFEVLHL